MAMYAGFWKRFAASIIDAIVLLVPGSVAGFGVGLLLIDPTWFEVLDQEQLDGIYTVVGSLVGLPLWWIYFAVMESSPLQATLGKMALGIKITGVDGVRIGFGRASGRHFGKWLGLIPLLGLIPFVMVAFTARKQGLHDMMAGCLVVKK